MYAVRDCPCPGRPGRRCADVCSKRSYVAAAPALPSLHLWRLTPRAAAAGRAGPAALEPTATLHMARRSCAACRLGATSTAAGWVAGGAALAASMQALASRASRSRAAQGCARRASLGRMFERCRLCPGRVAQLLGSLVRPGGSYAATAAGSLDRHSSSGRARHPLQQAL